MQIEVDFGRGDGQEGEGQGAETGSIGFEGVPGAALAASPDGLDADYANPAAVGAPDGLDEMRVGDLLFFAERGPEAAMRAS